MDKFIVSARKYRPQDFSTVVGQSHITTTLKNAIRNGQLAHAFLFCGPRGVGKTTCARILAKTINCENISPDGEACNHCHSCVSFNEGTSLNIHELDAASNNSVDDIRSLVEQVRFAPQAGKYKVYIIDEVHMLSTSAFNAFLKTLEEPPPYAIFILATTEKYKILPTILSRCQIFDFKRITATDTVHHLEEICEKEGIVAEKAALQLIAQKSEGCMRDALSILDKIVSFTNGELSYRNTGEHLNILDADYYFRMLDAMQQQDLSEALLIYDDINRKGFEGDLVLNGLAEFIRNLLVCKDEKVASLLEAVESFRDRYVRMGKKVDAAYLVSALNVVNDAEINYKSARNKRLHVELALIKLCYLAQAMQVIAESPGEKKKTAEPFRPVSFRSIPAMEPVTRREKKGPAEHGKEQEGAKQEGMKQPAAAKLMIESGVVQPDPDREPVRESASSSNSLSKIRQQIADRARDKESGTSRALEVEPLHQAWQQYADSLRENRNPAVQSLELAVLRIIDAQTFEVSANNNLEQRFIEQEKRGISDHLQQVFGNKAISFTVIVEEKAPTDEPVDRPLNKREQFRQIVEQYPLVRELKDRLRLELDY
ncbi:MAG TPA: DNA polymerase III subunit gamma/tau [Puia sp.]|nr:DNA polymerase III subunit gamma/tau [Puia sp.]